MAEEFTSAGGAAKPATPRLERTPGGASRDDELKKLKEALANDQREAEKLRKQLDETQSRIAMVEKAVAETKQLTSAFAAALEGITAERLAVQDVLANALPLLEKHDDVTSKKPEIAAKVKGVDAAIDAKEREERNLAQKLKEQQAAAKTASDESAAKKQELEALKGRQLAIQDKFAMLRKLRQRMSTEGASKPLVKYLLALELKRVWDETKGLLITKERLEADYNSKVEEVRAATAAAAAQDAKSKRVQSDLEAARRDLEARRNGRLDEVINRVGELTPGMPSGAGSNRLA